MANLSDKMKVFYFGKQSIIHLKNRIIYNDQAKHDFFKIIVSTRDEHIKKTTHFYPFLLMNLVSNSLFIFHFPLAYILVI